jgi:hypothetical protein
MKKITHGAAVKKYSTTLATVFISPKKFSAQGKAGHFSLEKWTGYSQWAARYPKHLGWPQNRTRNSLKSHNKLPRGTSHEPEDGAAHAGSVE